MATVKGRSPSALCAAGTAAESNTTGLGTTPACTPRPRVDRVASELAITAVGSTRARACTARRAGRGR